MATKNKCDSVIAELLKYDTIDMNELSHDAAYHLENCEKCRKELARLNAMHVLLKDCAPVSPDFRSTVLDSIQNDKIEILPEPKKKHHFPIGTIGAVAAMLIVYFTVSGTELSDIIFSGKFANETAADREFNSAPQQEAENGSGFLYFGSADSVDQEHDVLETENTVIHEKQKVALDPKSPTDSGEPKHKNQLTLYSKSEQEPTDSSALNDVITDNIELSDGLHDIVTETEEEVLRLPSSGGSGTSGGTSGGSASSGGESSLSETATENFVTKDDEYSYVNDMSYIITNIQDAEELYELLENLYPSRIPTEYFKSIESEKFMEFIQSLTDFDTEYTLENLEKFIYGTADENK